MFEVFRVKNHDFTTKNHIYCLSRLSLTVVYYSLFCDVPNVVCVSGLSISDCLSRLSLTVIYYSLFCDVPNVVCFSGLSISDCQTT
jgi:hypothetical protein